MTEDVTVYMFTELQHLTVLASSIFSHCALKFLKLHGTNNNNDSSLVISVTSSAVSLVRSEHHHFCSNIFQCRCNVSTLFYCTTLS